MSETTKKKYWKTAINLLTLIGLLVLCYLIRDQIFQTFRDFSKVNAYALLLILPIEFYNYDVYARMYKRLFGLLGSKTSYREMFKVSLELNMVNHVFPSGGVTGFSYFGLRLKPLGISSGKATLVQVMKFILLFVSFEVMLILGLLFLAIGGQANQVTILVSSSIATALLIGTFGAAFLVGSKRRINSFFTYITRIFNRIVHVARRNHPETIQIVRVERLFDDLHENYMIIKKDWRQLFWPAVFAFLANLTEIMALYVVYIAFGHWVNPGAVILAYAVANFAGLVSVLPGGAGIYEALMTAVLALAGVPPAVSIPVTVMYRVVNITIQIIPGYYYYHKAIHNSTTETT